MAEKEVLLLADPKKVRVRVRRHYPYEHWFVTIEPREGSTSLTASGKVVAHLVDIAMRMALEAGLDGVYDVAQEFPHPQYKKLPRCSCDDFCEGPCPAHPNPDNPYEATCDLPCTGHDGKLRACSLKELHHGSCIPG